MLIPLREVDQFADEKVVIVSTGSQGEPLSALRRMAYRDHPQVELRAGDTVVFSATPIPGNERAVNETIDRLYHVGCDVVTTRDAPIHASGHGHAEELKLMLNLTHPRYVMPVHGDYKRMLLHSQLAEAVGLSPESVFRTENGLPLEIDARGARFGERQPSGLVFVDGVEIGDVTDVALRDRRMLSADGIFIIVATVSRARRLLRRPAGGPGPRRARSSTATRTSSTSCARRSRTRWTAPPSSASPRSRCSSRCSTTTSRGSSTTACAGARWCCRSIVEV